MAKCFRLIDTERCMGCRPCPAAYQAEDSASTRAQAYWWLAGLFRDPPDAPFLVRLDTALRKAPKRTAVLDALHEALPRDEDAILAAQRDFPRLLRGLHEDLGPPPPYESVWREQRLFGDSTDAVLASYAEAGLADIDPTLGPQDHICVELKFMALLALQEHEAYLDGDTESARVLLDRQRHFLDNHLLQWVPMWAAQVRRSAHTPLYRALIDLLMDALEGDREDLDRMHAALVLQGDVAPRVTLQAESVSP